MIRIRTAFARLAQNDPSLRAALVPMVRQADKWKSLPKGWTQESVEKFWGTLTGENKHKVTKCIKDMEGKVDDPGAFCASLADKVMGPEWRSKKAALTHDQAVLKLIKENPDWPKGDLLDAIGTTSPRPSLDARKVQNRYWELRGGRRGPMPGEYDYRKRAMDYTTISTAALPPVLKRVLAEVRFNKRKITVNLRTSFSMYSAGDDGAKGFTALVDIDTNQYKVVWGAFGGGALGQKPSPVDDVNTPKKPLPDHLVVVQGQIGGRDPYASITCTPAALPRLTGAARMGSASKRAYFSVVLPPGDTQWHDPRKTLTRGAFKSRQEADLWAKKNIPGDPYTVQEYDDPEVIEQAMLTVARAVAKAGEQGVRVNTLPAVGVREMLEEKVVDAERGYLYPRQPAFDRWVKDLRGVRLANGDMMQYFADNPDKLAEKLERDKAKKTANDPSAFINTKTKALAKAAFGYLKNIKPSFGEPDLPSNVGGFITHLFLARGNRAAYTALHSFFGNMSGVGSGFGVVDELTRLARDFARKVNEGEATAMGVLLLRGAKRPRAAAAFEAWAMKNLDLAKHDPASSANEKTLRPSDTFEATITPEIKGIAVWAWGQIGKSPEAADTLSFRVAEDVNWHSIQAVGEHPGVEIDHDVVGRISQELDYGLEDVAAFIVALLRIAGLKRLAEAVKKQALREFTDSYGVLARIAARVLDGGRCRTANYASLAEAAVVTGDARYGKGSTDVWYVKSSAARDLMMGSRFVLRHGLPLPDPANLKATHVFLGKVDENNPNEVFGMMQGEVWSPNGEARPLVSRIGHTSMMVGDIVVVRGRPLMVDSPTGFFDLQKQSKVPQKVDKAWKGRDKKATLKLAADIRRVLYPLFQGVQPTLKRPYEEFLHGMSSLFVEMWENKWPDWEVVKVETDEVGYETVQGKLLYRQTMDSPAEYAEHEVEYPEVVNVVAKLPISFLWLVRHLTEDMSYYIADRREFQQRFLEILGNRRAVSMLGKLLADGAKHWAKDVPEFLEWNQGLYDDVQDFVNDEMERGWSLNWSPTPKGSRVNKTWAKVMGQGLDVYVDLMVAGEVDNVEFEEDYNYDPPDDDDDERYHGYW